MLVKFTIKWSLEVKDLVTTVHLSQTCDFGLKYDKTIIIA